MRVLARVEGRSDDMVMLRLLEAHCIPILSYAIEVIFVKDRCENRQLRVAYNSVYRKLFGYSYRESVSLLQRTLKRPVWEELVEERKAKFLSRRHLWPTGSLVRAFPQFQLGCFANRVATFSVFLSSLFCIVSLACNHYTDV